MSSFVNKTNLLSYLGQNNDELKFIKSNLGKKIIFDFISKKDSPTIIKERFVEEINNRKIFGAYSLNDSSVSSIEEKKIRKKLSKFLKKSNLVIVSDYGHGLISKKILQKRLFQRKNLLL